MTYYLYFFSDQNLNLFFFVEGSKKKNVINLLNSNFSLCIFFVSIDEICCKFAFLFFF